MDAEIKEIPQYLYKILSFQNWQTSQKSSSIFLSAEDNAFIHFSKEAQLERILVKYWSDADQYVILKIDASKLPGDLIYETNPGGSAKYFHLYNGSIPFCSVAESKIVYRKPIAPCDLEKTEIVKSGKSKFAVIYRGYLKPGREEEYLSSWNIVAHYFVKYRGAMGSCLHRTEDGMWVAYSRWPDQKTRDSSWPGDNAPSEELPDFVRTAVLSIQDCLDPDRKLPDICMEVVEDLLFTSGPN